MNKKFTLIYCLTLIFLFGSVANGQNGYTWIGADGASWIVGTNWTPTRIPQPNDTLFFTGGGTKNITFVPSESIGRMRISGNTSIVLSSGLSVTLTIGNGPGNDFIVEGGSSLTLGGANPITITLNTSASGFIAASGTFTINSGCIYNTDGTSVNTVVEGTVVNRNTITCSSASKLTFGGGSKYHVAATGTTLPTATWAPSSLIEFNTGTETMLTVTSQTVGQVRVSNSTPATISANVSSTLTIADFTGDDFVINSGSSLIIGTNVDITLSNNASADITGFLTISSGRTYNTSGSGVVTIVTGAITYNGSLNSSTASNLQFQNNSRLIVTASGKTIPPATWNANSTIELNTSGVMTFDFGSSTPLTIGRLVVLNSTDATISSSAALNLNISNGSGNDLDIVAGSSLIIGGANPLTVSFAAGANAAINGPMTINASKTFVAGGTGSTVNINAAFTNNGTYDFSSTTAITTISALFANNGTLLNSSASRCTVGTGVTYRHNVDGGSVLIATWNANSTIEIIGITGTAPTGLEGQTFRNFIWNCDQAGPITLGASFTITGNMTISQTGDESLILADASSRTLTINGNFILSAASANDNFIVVGSSGDGTLVIGGNFTKTGSSAFTLKNGDGIAVLNITGNFDMSAGNFNQRAAGTSNTSTVLLTGNFNFSGGQYDFSSAAADGILNVTGNFSHTAGTITESGTGSGSIFFNKSGVQTYTSGGTVSNTINFTVNSGTTLQMASGSTVISGNGSFTLSNSATLGITSADGITTSGATGNVQVVGTRTFNSGASYIYNGSIAQNTGDGYPNALTGSLTINNSNGVSIVAANRTITTGTLNLTLGAFNTNNGGNRLSMGSIALINRGNGSLIGTLLGSGVYDVIYTGDSKTTDDELSGTGLRNITLNLNSGQNLTLNSSINIDGTLTFTSGKMLTGAHTVDLGTTGTISGETDGKYLVGNLTVTRNVGTAQETFGGIGVTIKTGNDILGNTVIERVSGPGVEITADYGDESISRIWTITPTSSLTEFRHIVFNWVADDNNGKVPVRYIGVRSPNGSSPWYETGSYSPLGNHPLGSIELRVDQFSVFTVIDKAETPYLFNFGTGSGIYNTAGQSDTFLPDAETNGGNSIVSIGTSSDGSWELESSGTFGTQTSLKGVAPSTNQPINKFSITNLSSTHFFTIRFDVMLEGGNSGDWFFFAGTGETSFTGTSFNYSTSNDVFLGLWWQFANGGKIITRYLDNVEDEWNLLDSNSFVQNTIYTVDIFVNNSEEAGFYYPILQSDMNPRAWDLWVSGLKLSPAGGFSKAYGINRASINSLSFQGRNSFGNVANIHLDDINYANYFDQDSPPLPVELTSFTGNIINSVVQLKWKTETEVNNFGFDIERSVNQKEWEKIGFVKGYGNSSSPKDYSFIDNEVKYGIHSYRLKQIDNDGKYEYSDVVQLDLGLPKEVILYPNYPNPFNPATTITFTLPKESNVALKVFNILGEEIKTLIDEKKEAGIHTVEFDGSGLTSGFYIYRIETQPTGGQGGDFVKVRKMLLIK